MSSNDIDDLLTSQGYGILSLCREGTPYSIPISFGYDGEDIYFGLLEDGPEPTKFAFIDDGATARLLVTDIRGRFDWRSIAITGPVEELDPDDPDWEHFIDTLAENAWFMRAFEHSDAIESIQGWKLQTDEL
ncbi:pyridoxamine 5'-phosphate oxidase family protein [Halonotius terrestris]|nr:pyridoxamine 5'-phosphate oxidase family protein [Halonotius terrestris]